MFFSYPVLEIWILSGGGLKLHARERKLRWALAVGSLMCLVAFLTPYVLSMHADDLDLCCSDEWRIPTLDDARKAKANGKLGTMVSDWQHNETATKQLVDTASGFVRSLKIAALVFEVLDGLCIGASLFVVWYYCPERGIEV